MSKSAIWAPRKLENWDWQESSLDERDLQTLGLEAWSRPEHLKAGEDPSKEGRLHRPRPSQVLAWIGFTVSGMAGLVAALSMIYLMLDSTLTGVVLSPGRSLVVLAVAASVGLFSGIVGLVVDSRNLRRFPSASPSDPRDRTTGVEAA